MQKKKEIAKKMGAKDSGSRMAFYRTLKNKSDYGKMHMKAMSVPRGEIQTKHGFSGTENMNEMGGNTGIKPRK